MRIIALDSYIQLRKSHPWEENQLILCVSTIFVLLNSEMFVVNIFLDFIPPEKMYYIQNPFSIITF